MKEIYLDNSATTPMSAAAREKFLAVATEGWGNASSLHARGVQAAHTLSEARRALLRALGARDGQIVFTGSGSEANNLAILGRAYAKERYRRGARILTTKGEHASVAMPLARLASEGFDVVEIDTKGGRLDREALSAALTPNTVLVTLMAVNNETGAAYELSGLRREMAAKAPDAVLHTDATQAFGKLPISVMRDGFDLVTVSAHKIGGGQGCGALYVSPALIKSKGLAPLILGGGQEGGLRSGTENLAGIAAFGVAAEEAARDREDRAAHMREVGEYLLSCLEKEPVLSEFRVNTPSCRAPHIYSLTLPSIKSETALHFLSSRGICVSSGSACSSHGRHGSPPLIAFGLSEREADCTIRISLSQENTQEDMDALCRALCEAVTTLARIR